MRRWNTNLWRKIGVKKLWNETNEKLQTAVRIDIIEDFPTLCVHLRCILLLVKLIHRIHLEGWCVHSNLNLVRVNCHTTIFGVHRCDGSYDACRNTPNTHLHDQPHALTWELDELDFTIHNSMSTMITLLFLELVPHFGMSRDAATVHSAHLAQVLPQALVPKEG